MDCATREGILGPRGRGGWLGRLLERESYLYPITKGGMALGYLKGGSQSKEKKKKTHISSGEGKETLKKLGCSECPAQELLFLRQT